MALFRTGDIDVTETQAGGVTRYAFDGTRIYRIGVECFPDHFTNVYLILDTTVTLVDVGFNGEKARADLLAGLRVVNGDFGEKVGLEDVTGIFITHGHGDHFGMLENDSLKGKRVYIHSLDGGIIKDYRREYTAWKGKMTELAREAGCRLDTEELFPIDRLNFEPSDYDVVEVVDGQQIIDGYEVCHTPGHSPGCICLGVGPVLFLGDHMLSLTTPHQVPRSSWQGVGLETYVSSLRKVAGMGVGLGLAAHEDTIYSVKGRAEEIEAFHFQRLMELMGLCKEEKTLYQLTCEYYRGHPELIQASGIEGLAVDETFLALEEIKAHVEYLLDHDRLEIAGVDGGAIRYIWR
jgi:glyoxylase-like metal-dependent hydrolase (beta-lactamase superfamily II)